MELMSFYAVAMLTCTAGFVLRAHALRLNATSERQGTTLSTRPAYALKPVTVTATRDRRFLIATDDVAPVLGGCRD